MVVFLLSAGGVVALGGQGLAFRVSPEESESPVALGATAILPGGVARINGVLPLDEDDWKPSEPAAELGGPALTGFHRVRVVVELAAQDEDGLPFDPSEYVLEDWAGAGWTAAWASPSRDHLLRGEIRSATLVYEIPNEAGHLVLIIPGGGRLTVRAGHPAEGHSVSGH